MSCNCFSILAAFFSLHSLRFFIDDKGPLIKNLLLKSDQQPAKLRFIYIQITMETKDSDSWLNNKTECFGLL